jgi:MoxR-like ATPase
MSNKTEQIIGEIKKVIVGKDEIIAKVLMSILSNGHVLLEDVPGVGKTTLALCFSRVLGLHYKRVQFTSDSVPSDVIGFSVLDKDSNKFVYKPGAVITNLLLADEINRTSSRTQSALLEVMEDGQVTVDSVSYQLPNPFIVIATQNPVGSAGTQMLPASQLDRFMICLTMGYPDFQSQIDILKDRHEGNPLDAAAAVVSKDDILAMQQEVQTVHIADPVYAYITDLAEKTRVHPMVQLGISPRGAFAVCQMAKAYAYAAERDYVIPEDVRDILADVCAHRLILNPKAKMIDVRADAILAEVLNDAKMPTLQDASVSA